MKSPNGFSQSNISFACGNGKTWLLFFAVFLSAPFLYQTYGHAQVSINIGPNITLSAGGSNPEIVLDGDWTNNGTFEPGTGKVTFNGNTNQIITNPTGETFYDITVNKGGGEVVMNGNATVNGTMAVQSGDVDLNGNNITMGPTALLTETALNTIKGSPGFVIAQRNLNGPANNNVAGMGFEITSAANLGITEIKRGHGVQTGNGNQSVLRFFDVSPTKSTGLNATIEFHYDESELNGNTEAGLQLFRSTDGGATWMTRDGTPDPGNNQIDLGGVNALSRWTTSSNSMA
jgi:hypothetical protein